MEPSPEAATYREVIADFCRRMKLDDVDAVSRGAMIAVAGVHLAITLNEVVPESPALSIYVDVGMPPRAGEAAVLRVLLQMNHAQSANRGLVYCIAPVNGHVIGVIHVGLGGLQGQGLEALVNSLVDTALEYRRTYFLWGPATEADAQGRDFSPSP